MPSILSDKHGADHPHGILPGHVYAVTGLALGGVAFLIAMSVVVYKCYRARVTSSGSPDSRQLSSAIRKGLQEQANHGSMKRSSSVKSVGSPRVSPTGSAAPMMQHDMNPERGVRRSPSGQSGGGTDATSMRPVDCYVADENDNRGAMSPGEKDEGQRETAVDELKMPHLGNLHFTAEYDHQKTALLVTIARAADLPIKDQEVGSSDPYIKLQLLPEKRHKVKTRVLRKTLNPVYDEIFTFYGIHANQLATITLHFVVLSFDRFSRDDVIGEVVYPLAGVLTGDSPEVTVSREIMPRTIKIHSQGRGEALVSLCYQPAANRLTVVVLKARNLPKMDITGLADPYVKIYLLYNGQRIAKKKTHVKKRTLNPVFNESFLFDVPCNEGLQNISLEFVLLDWDRVTKNDTIGRLEIGAKLEAAEGHHWNEVMNCPRKQIAEWHKLKE